MRCPALRNLCKDDVEVCDLIDEASKREGGGDKRSAESQTTVDNVNSDPRPVGNSRDAALRRLCKDQPDLHEQVIARGDGMFPWNETPCGDIIRPTDRWCGQNKLHLRIVDR
jgi:hypothetical protein